MASALFELLHLCTFFYYATYLAATFDLDCDIFLCCITRSLRQNV